MAKGQKRSNREIRKLKQEKQPASFDKTLLPDRSAANATIPKNKKKKR